MTSVSGVFRTLTLERLRSFNTQYYAINECLLFVPIGSHRKRDTNLLLVDTQIVTNHCLQIGAVKNRQPWKELTNIGKLHKSDLRFNLLMALKMCLNKKYALK